MASKQSYIATRIAEQHNVDEYVAKEMSLDLVMTAFMASRIKGASRAASVEITGKELQDAVHQLNDGKAIMVNSRADCELYYVVAHENDLIAAFYPIGPWQEIYAVIASHPDVLDKFGIHTPSFMDKAIIDKMFRFPVKVKKADKEVTASEEVIAAEVPAWTWHKASPVMAEEEENAVVVLAEVAPDNIAPQPEPIESRLDSQMEQAFSRAGGGHQGGSRGHRGSDRQSRRATETA